MDYDFQNIPSYMIIQILLNNEICLGDIPEEYMTYEICLKYVKKIHILS